MLAPLRRRAEWSFVRFVRGMYAGDPPDSWAPEVPLDLGVGLSGAGKTRPLFEHVVPLIAKGTWKFLAANGGYRKRDVIVSGRARAGRLWDESIWGAAPLAISSGTISWLAVLHDAIVASAFKSPISDAGVANAARFAGFVELTDGDRLALTAALTALYRTQRMFDSVAEEAIGVTPRLPAFALAHPRVSPEMPAWTLGDGHETTALQFFDDAIANSWVAEVQRLRSRVTLAEQGPAYERLARLVGSLFTAAKPDDRAHFLVPVARFYPLLWRDLGGAAGISQMVEKSAGALPTRGEREHYESRVGDLLHFGVRLDDRVQQILQTAWPDRTESQKRLVVEHETRYREIRDEVRTLARRLRRELG